MDKKYVVGIGEILWDLLPAGKQLGGAPANFAYHIAQLGLESKTVSAIGRDKLGNEIVQILNDTGLDYLLERVDMSTGVVDVELDTKGVPTYHIKENVAWDNIPFTSALAELAHQTRAVCFGSLAQRNEISRQTIHMFLDAMPTGEGVYRIFDINLRQHYYTKSLIKLSLQQCDILKINDDELRIITPMFNYSSESLQKAAIRFLTDYQLRMVILTCGAEGSYVFTLNEVSFLETPHVDVVDTVGAGDAFTAAFVAALLEGKNVKDAHRLAVQVSAFVCTKAGAMPLLPTYFKQYI